MGLTPGLRTGLRAFARGWAALLLGAAILALAMLGGSHTGELRFERAAIAGGELWRLVSGHLVHLGVSHAFLNALGLLLIAWLVGKEYTLRQWLLVSAVTIAAIDAGLWWLEPELEWYVGLSGVLHGWLAAGIVAQIRGRRPDALLLAALLAGKLVFEALFGALPGSEETAGGPVVTEAHLYGAAGGLLSGVLLSRFVRGRRL